MRLPAVLRRVAPDTVDALTARLAQAEADYQAAQSRLEALSRRRQELLLEDDDAALAELKAETDAVVLARDKAGARALDAKRRIQEAQERAIRERRDAIYREGLEAHERSLELIARYGELVPEIVDIARGLQQTEATIMDCRRRLRVEGDGRDFPDVDQVARPQRGGGVTLQPQAIHVGLRLPSPADGTAMAWPEGRDIFGGAAISADRGAA